MKKLCDAKYPTNDDFRNAIYDQYLSKNNISLILRIYINPHSNKKYPKSLLIKYKFDGATYDENNNYNHHNHRMLVDGNNASEISDYRSPETVEFDILNARTYNEY